MVINQACNQSIVIMLKIHWLGHCRGPRWKLHCSARLLGGAGPLQEPHPRSRSHRPNNDLPKHTSSVFPSFHQNW